MSGDKKKLVEFGKRGLEQNEPAEKMLTAWGHLKGSRHALVAHTSFAQDRWAR